MQKIYCDRCGCELTTLTDFRVVIGGTPVESFNLCGDCREDLIDWLADGAPVEAAEPVAEDDDPLYGGPKNDKVGYTVEELIQTSGRDFYAVLANLERLGVTPAVWKRDGKTFCKFYLSPGDLDRLSAD